MAWALVLSLLGGGVLAEPYVAWKVETPYLPMTLTERGAYYSSGADKLKLEHVDLQGVRKSLITDGPAVSGDQRLLAPLPNGDVVLGTEQPNAAVAFVSPTGQVKTFRPNASVLALAPYGLSNAVAVLGDGDSRFLARYNRNGLMWVRPLGEDNMDPAVLEAEGTIYVSTNFELRKYSGTGSLIWTREVGPDAEIRFNPKQGPLAFSRMGLGDPGIELRQFDRGGKIVWQRPLREGFLHRWSVDVDRLGRAHVMLWRSEQTRSDFEDYWDNSAQYRRLSAAGVVQFSKRFQGHYSYQNCGSRDCPSSSSGVRGSGLTSNDEYWVTEVVSETNQKVHVLGTTHRTMQAPYGSIYDLRWTNRGVLVHKSGIYATEVEFWPRVAAELRGSDGPGGTYRRGQEVSLRLGSLQALYGPSADIWFTFKRTPGNEWIPERVRLPAGQTERRLFLKVPSLAPFGKRTITGTAQNMPLRLSYGVGPKLVAMSVEDPSVKAGEKLKIRIDLDSPAPAGGHRVELIIWGYSWVEGWWVLGPIFREATVPAGSRSLTHELVAETGWQEISARQADIETPEIPLTIA